MEKASYINTAHPEGREVLLTLKERNLYLYLSEKDVIIWRLDAGVTCTYDGNKLKLSRNNKPESLECVGETAQRIYQVWSSPVEEEKKEKRPLVSYTPFFIFCCTIVAIGLIVYFLLIPWLGKKLIDYIPERVEIELGDALSKQYAIQYKSNDSANYYINKFCTQLKLNTSYPIHVEVLDSEELNAFALPGGRIFVYKGLLNKLNSYEELAALLGHEASHVIKRHSLKSILRTAASGIVIAALLGDFSEMSAWVLSKANDFKELDYSRELETEADDEGYTVLLKSRINPNGMLRLLEVLKKESVEMPTMMKYLSTHPDTQARIENIKQKSGLQFSYPKQEEFATCFTRLKSVL